MSNHFSEQLHIRKEIAREQWEEYRRAPKIVFEVGDDAAMDTALDSMNAARLGAMSFADFWAEEFDRWMVNAATDCMRSLGAFSPPAFALN